MSRSVCPTCGAPCDTDINMRGGDYGWGTSDLERTTYRYAAPEQPTQPTAQDARNLFDAGWKAAARFCDREDVVADGIVGEGACPQFEQAFDAAIAAQQGDRL